MTIFFVALRAFHNNKSVIVLSLVLAVTILLSHYLISQSSSWVIKRVNFDKAYMLKALHSERLNYDGLG